MNCPKCNHKLISQEYEGMTVDKCLNCGGMWFDFKELDQLEDTILSEDEMKGTLVWGRKPAKEKCPKCGIVMTQFDYRLNNLHLEYCEKNMHGFWLDKGEEERIVEEMKESIERFEKKYKAEEEWANHLRRLRSPSFFSKLTDLFK